MVTALSITSLLLFLEPLYIASSVKSTLTDILNRTYILESKTFFRWQQFCPVFQLQQEPNGVQTYEIKSWFCRNVRRSFINKHTACMIKY